MGALNLAAAMDGIADAVKDAGITNRVFPYPHEDPPVPCFVVGYPEAGDIEFDFTFGRGSDRAVIPCWFIVGAITTRTTRDALSAVLAGNTGIKEAIDGDLGGAVQTARCSDAEIEPVMTASGTYLAIRFDVEVIS